MGFTVFYYLRVDNQFVKLQDMDEILCNLSGVSISEKNYMIPTGNDVSWKDLLTNILLELPSSKCCNHVVNLDDIIEAVCHYQTCYHIEDVIPYIKCFHIMKMIGIQILVHYDNLSMFDNKQHNYYRHLYDNEVWMNKEGLIDYVKHLDMTEETKKSHKAILYNIYNSANKLSVEEKREFINRYDNRMIYQNDTGLYECDQNGTLLHYYPAIDNLSDNPKVRHYDGIYYTPCVIRMIIPEGVTKLSTVFFKGSLVEQELYLPSSLKYIGTEYEPGVFANACLPKVTLPDSLVTIGRKAFAGCKIEELVYPRKRIEYKYWGQFQDASIKILSVPETFKLPSEWKTEASIENVYYYH